MDFTALRLSLMLAGITTLLLIPIALPLAWWLARTPRRLGGVVNALVALPLVLPPTVLGFYLLIAMGPQGPLGHVSIWLTGGHLAFTFTGLIIGSMVYSLPFAVQPLRDAFAAQDRGLWDAAASLGAGPFDRFCTVALPLAWPGLLSASVLTFAHTIGEFGIVLMIGGNIPDRTQVASISIWNQVESLRYSQAHQMSAILLGLCFLLLLLVFLVGQRRPKGRA